MVPSRRRDYAHLKRWATLSELAQPPVVGRPTVNGGFPTVRQRALDPREKGKLPPTNGQRGDRGDNGELWRE